MVQRVATVAFEGIEARAVDVQVQVAPGLPAFKHVARQCQKAGYRVPYEAWVGDDAFSSSSKLLFTEAASTCRAFNNARKGAMPPRPISPR